MELSLSGKVVLITGASRGLGKDIAVEFAEERATVVICARNIANLESITREIRVNDPHLAGIQCDVTNRKDVVSMMNKIRDDYGHLDVLVNNAGGPVKFGTYMEYAKADPMSDELWKDVWQLNVEGTRYCCEEAFPILKGYCREEGRSSRYSSIVNICSLPAHQPGDHNPHYSVAKAAQLNYTKAISRVWGRYGIRANAVCPGSLMGGAWETNIQARATRESVSFEEAKRRTIETDTAKLSLPYLGTLEDVANLVVFLASDRARYITGQCIDVDGGACRAIS
ncbi:MAG: SDR family NAD(P)-dependent oxidoreductase [Patescibacteria group bacterium]